MPAGYNNIQQAGGENERKADEINANGKLVKSHSRPRTWWYPSHRYEWWEESTCSPFP